MRRLNVFDELQAVLKVSRDALCLNLFQVASGLLRQQEQQEFPILDLISSRIARNYRIYLFKLNPKDRHELVWQSFRWRHREALQLRGEAVQAVYPPAAKKAFDTCFKPTPEEESQLGVARYTQKLPSQMDGKQLWKALRHGLESGLHVKTAARGRTESLYEVRRGEWQVITRLDRGRAQGQISLAHDIQAAPYLFLMRQLSIPTIIGLPFEARWELGPAGDEEILAQQILMISQRFQDLLPELLAGVSCPLTSGDLLRWQQFTKENLHKAENKSQ